MLHWPKKSLVMPFYYINFDQNGPPYLSPSLYRGSTVHMLDTATATATVTNKWRQKQQQQPTTTQTKSLKEPSRAAVKSSLIGT